MLITVAVLKCTVWETIQKNCLVTILTKKSRKDTAHKIRKWICSYFSVNPSDPPNLIKVQ